MVMDRNPYFGEDEHFERTARNVANTLWEATKGDVSLIPDIYLSTLQHEYSDGTVSLLQELNKVAFEEGTSFEEFSEVVDSLIRVNPESWPEPDTITEIQPSKLLYEIETEPVEFNEEEFDFAAPGDMSSKMELFFKKVISSVYTDGVTSVTDKDGNPPNAQNNYLMAGDGKSFSGIFYDSPPNEDSRQYPFEIKESGDKWTIKY